MNEAEYAVEQKIGRNVLLFQRIEATLKDLLTHNNVAGYPNELETCLQERISSLRNQTMGTLAGQFNSGILSKSETATMEPETLAGIRVSFNIKIENDNLKDSLGTVVSERNRLIHHFLQEIDLTSTDGMSAAIEYLDQQYQKARLIYNDLTIMVKFLDGISHLLTAFCSSDAVQKYCDLWFVRGRRVMELLSDAARENARPDGWAELSAAGKALSKEAPDELAALKAACGKRTLKGFLLVTECFEIFEEPTPNGGVRVLYRMKPEQAWQVKA
jgi:hypothetical protein